MGKGITAETVRQGRECRRLKQKAGEAEVSAGKYGAQTHWSAKQLCQDVLDKKRKLDVPKKTCSCRLIEIWGSLFAKIPKLKD